MAVSARRRLEALAVVAAVVVAVVGVSAVRADPSPPLPSIEADSLISSSMQALASAYTISGDVSTLIDLGLPELPTQLGGGVAGPATLLIGRQRFKVWHSPDGVRAAHLMDFREQDLVANSHEAWFWDSRGMVAWHLRARDLPAGHETGPTPLTPADFTSFAREVLEVVAPYAAVSVEGTARVADRPVYELVLTPTSDLTRIGRIVASIDADTRLPLRLRVVPRGSAEAAIEAGFTSVSFEPIDPSMFAFIPPTGAIVKTAEDIEASAGEAGHMWADARGAQPSPAGGFRVFGEGFDLRFAASGQGPLPDDVGRLLPYAGPLASVIVVDRPGGTWLLAGFVGVATLERDAATLP
jgi:outer membrane lipoprotein-sorting protein